MVYFGQNQDSELDPIKSGVIFFKPKLLDLKHSDMYPVLGWTVKADLTIWYLYISIYPNMQEAALGFKFMVLKATKWPKSGPARSYLAHGCQTSKIHGAIAPLAPPLNNSPVLHTLSIYLCIRKTLKLIRAIWNYVWALRVNGIWGHLITM